MTTFRMNWRHALLAVMPVLGAWTLVESPRPRSIDFCATWLDITQSPSSPTTGATAQITVEYGETFTQNPACLSMGGPDPSSFRFTVNGTDVTSYFNATEGIATAGAVPLVAGNNTLVASVEGHAASGDQYTQTDEVQVERSSDATPAVTASGNADTLELDRASGVRFRVQNTGGASGTFALACGPSSGLTCVATTPSSVTLAPNDTAVAIVTVRASALGAKTVALTASGSTSSTATIQLPVVQRALLAPAMPASGRVDRSLCPTTTVSPGAAVQCGDLLYAHTLPGYRSMGRARAITLLYNSATVAGRSPVALDYRYYPSRGAAQGLRFDVFRPGTPRRLIARAYYAVDGGSADMVHARLNAPVVWDSLAAAIGGNATGSYPLTLSVVRKLAGTWREDLADTSTARLNVVDRRDSFWGAGWWMSGLERGYEDANGVLIAFADGSSSYFPGPGMPGASPPGERSWIEYQHLLGYTRILQGKRVQVRYMSGGLPTALVDTNPVRNMATYHWSAGGARLDSIVDPVGRKSAFRYDASGRVAAIYGPRGDSTLLAQSVKAGASTADLDAITDPDGFTTPFGYQGASHLLASSQARATGAVAYAFDAATMTLDSASAPAGVTAPGRRVRAWQRVGAASGPFSATEATPLALVSAESATAVVSWWRLAGGQQVRDTAWFRVHATGAPIVIKVPESAPMTITRDSIGQPTRVRTSGGAEVSQVWNTDGNLVSTSAQVRVRWTDTATRTDITQYEYHPVWKSLSKTTTPLGVITRVTYDGYGRVDTLVDPLGRATRVTYKPRGMVERVIGPHPTLAGQFEPNPETYLYDSSGTAPTWNLIRVLKGEHGPTYEYDATKLRPNAVVDPVGNRTVYEYDDIGRPITIQSIPQVWSSGDQSFQGTQAEQRDVHYLYDDVARTRRMTGSRKLFMLDSLDAAGRVTRHCLDYNWCEKISYEDGLNPTRHERRRGDVILQTFDGAGRLTNRTSKRSAAAVPEDVVTYGYDADGHMVKADNRYSKLRWRYDIWGRLRSEEQRIRGYVDTLRFSGVTFFHDYDADGRRSRTYTAEAASSSVQCGWCSGGRTDSILVNPIGLQAYTYYDDGALWQMSNDYWAPGGKTWTYTYDRKGQPTQLAMPTTVTGRHYSFSYDALDRQVAHRFGVSGGFETDTLMLFDPAGRVLHMQHNAAETKYVYDGMGRLRYNSAGRINADSMRYDANGNVQRSGVWDYVYDIDQNGNRGHLIHRGSGFCRIDYTHDGNGNQTRSTWLDKVTCEAQSGTAGERMHASDFDAEGRMVRDTTRFRTRNVNNDIVDRTEVRRFWYDGLGRRVLQHSAATTADDHGVHRYFWAGDHVAVKVQNAVEGNPSNGHPDELWPSPTTGSLGSGQWFLYEPGVDRVLGRMQGAGQTRDYRLYYRDHHGSVMRVTNEHGTALSEAASRYESFGAPINAPTGAEARPGYNGLESPGGLVYMRNRWYDPQSGRFTQEDPIGYAGGSNLYAYAGNNPVTFSDPFGLCPVDKDPEKRNMNVDDCDNDDAGKAARLLKSHGGQEGLSALRILVASGASVTFRSSLRQQRDGCSDACTNVGKQPPGILLTKNASPVENATRLVHETTHLMPGKGQDCGPAEELSWNRALNAYDSIKAGTGATSNAYESKSAARAAGGRLVAKSC